MDEMAGRRRPSTWRRPPGSTGSVPYTSPQSLAPGPMSYCPPSSTAFNFAAYEQPGLAHTSPPQQHQYTASQMPQHSAAAQQPYDIQSQLFQQPSGQQYGFHQDRPLSHAHPSISAATPSHQFASWGGYNSSSGPDALDEENAIPPKPCDWGTNAK